MSLAPALVLWDLDGTLVDSREDIAHAGNVARAVLGLAALPVPEIAAMVGDGMGMLLRRLCPDVDPPAFAAAESAFVAHYAEHCADRSTAYPGVLDCLNALQAASISQAVVTNKPLGFTRRILETLGLAPFFATVQGGDGPRKPAPDQLLAACADVAADPVASWMVGDHHTDLRAGRAAGCRIAFCAWGIGHPDGIQPDLQLERPQDLLEALALVHRGGTAPG
jgi:phosphoglycolate phosphatase